MIEAQTEAARLRKRRDDAIAAYSAGKLGIDHAHQITADLEPKIKAAERRARKAATPALLEGLAGETEAVVRQR